MVLPYCDLINGDDGLGALRRNLEQLRDSSRTISHSGFAVISRQLVAARLVIAASENSQKSLSRDFQNYGIVRACQSWPPQIRAPSDRSIETGTESWPYGSGSITSVASRVAGRFGPEHGMRRSQMAIPEIDRLARPLFRPAPRSAMVFPLVVLVAILPGLVALNAWDLTPPAPLWGLRGLAVLGGMALDQTPFAASIKPAQEAAAFRMVSFQPPLYAWLEAIGFWLSADCDPLASVLPSYVAGALAIVLVYLHGRLWRGAGLGLTAAFLVGFNQSLLLRIQEATPSTLALCGVLATLLAYGWHERVSNESTRPWRWASPIVWTVAGGLAFGLTLLTLGGIGLLVIPIVLLHKYYLRGTTTPSPPRGRMRAWLRSWRDDPALFGGMLSLVIAVCVAVPWFAVMFAAHGWEAITALGVPPDALVTDRWSGLLPRLIDLAPVTLPLGLFGAVWAVRSALIDETNTREAMGGSLWVIWLAVAALAPAVWPDGSRSACDLNMLVPLNLLAAQTLADLVNRRVSIKVLIGLAPATAMSVAWWASAALNEAVNDLARGRADATTALGLHLVLDLVVASIFVIRAPTPLGPTARRPPAWNPCCLRAGSPRGYRRRRASRGRFSPWLDA